MINFIKFIIFIIDMDMDESLLKEKEGEHFDRTRSFENPDSIGETIAAFATCSGGYLAIGQADDHSIFGVPNEAEAVSKLGQILRNCDPIPTREGPKFIEVEGKKVALLRIISLGKAGPCFYKEIPYMRVMDSNKKIPAGSLYKLWSQSGRISFEERESSASKAEIDGEAIDYYRAKLATRGDFNADAWMQSKKLSLDHGLTNLGVLILAKNPANHLSRPQITLIRYRGNAPTDRVASITLSQPLHKLLASCENFLKINLLVSEKMEGMKRIEDTIVPWAAVREAIVNAIAHRDYESASETIVKIFDDRVEFINPGAPDPESWKKIVEMQWPIHRNPLLYEFIRLEGVGEGAGQGIPIMKKAMEAAGLQEPEYIVARDSFMVVLHAKQAVINIKPPEELIKLLVKKNGITTNEIIKALKVSRPTAIGLMELVIATGQWKKIGSTRGRIYVKVKSPPQ